MYFDLLVYLCTQLRAYVPIIAQAGILKYKKVKSQTNLLGMEEIVLASLWHNISITKTMTGIMLAPLVFSFE